MVYTVNFDCNEFAMVFPISAGLSQTAIPAFLSDSILSEAVPFPPAIIAPAWPMRRPGGAVCPAMNATTDLSKLLFWIH